MGDKYYELENKLYKNAPQKIKDNFFWTKDEFINYYSNENKPIQAPPKEFVEFLKSIENQPYFCACFKKEKMHEFIFQYNPETGRVERIHEEDNFVTGANCDYIINWNGESSDEIEVLYFVFQHLHFCDLTEYDFEEWMNLRTPN